jgi:ABC-type transport system involved in cytochrome bd biosynthesis fused ATPase/permease subunit
MKFRDGRVETRKTIETVCLILSLGVIFIQIWILATTLEAYFQGKTEHLMASVILSLIAFGVAALTAWTVGNDFMKGSEEGRTQTYNKHTQF